MRTTKPSTRTIPGPPSPLFEMSNQRKRNQIFSIFIDFFRPSLASNLTFCVLYLKKNISGKELSANLQQLPLSLSPCGGGKRRRRRRSWDRRQLNRCSTRPNLQPSNSSPSLSRPNSPDQLSQVHKNYLLYVTRYSEVTGHTAKIFISVRLVLCFKTPAL